MLYAASLATRQARRASSVSELVAGERAATVFRRVFAFVFCFKSFGVKLFLLKVTEQASEADGRRNYSNVFRSRTCPARL